MTRRGPVRIAYEPGPRPGFVVSTLDGQRRGRHETFAAAVRVAEAAGFEVVEIPCVRCRRRLGVPVGDVVVEWRCEVCSTLDG